MLLLLLKINLACIINNYHTRLFCKWSYVFISVINISDFFTAWQAIVNIINSEIKGNVVFYFKKCHNVTLKKIISGHKICIVQGKYTLSIHCSVSDCRMIQCSRMKESRAPQRNSTLWVTLLAPLHRFPSQHEMPWKSPADVAASQIDLETQPFTTDWPPTLTDEKNKSLSKLEICICDLNQMLNHKRDIITCFFSDSHLLL